MSERLARGRMRPDVQDRPNILRASIHRHHDTFGGGAEIDRKVCAVLRRLHTRGRADDEAEGAKPVVYCLYRSARRYADNVNKIRTMRIVAVGLKSIRGGIALLRLTNGTATQALHDLRGAVADAADAANFARARRA